jgi:hypothetical protein
MLMPDFSVPVPDIIQVGPGVPVWENAAAASRSGKKRRIMVSS